VLFISRSLFIGKVVYFLQIKGEQELYLFFIKVYIYLMAKDLIFIHFILICLMIHFLFTNLFTH